MTEEHYVESSIDGCKIHLEITTNYPSYGNPVVLLHGKNLPPQFSYGFKLDGKSAADLMADQGITCIMPSCLGFGKSVGSSENGYEDWYRDILDILKWLKYNKGINKVSILGWSSSAVPALIAASRLPETINSVIAYGITKHYYHDGMYMQKRPFFMYTTEQLSYRRYKDIPENRKQEIFPIEWYDRLNTEIAKVLPLKVPAGTDNDRIDVINGKPMSAFVRIEDIKCPALFTSGEWDTDCDINSLYDYAKMCKGNVSVIKDGTHWVLMEKNRNKMVDVVSNFVKENNVSNS